MNSRLPLSADDIAYLDRLPLTQHFLQAYLLQLCQADLQDIYAQNPQLYVYLHSKYELTYQPFLTAPDAEKYQAQPLLFSIQTQILPYISYIDVLNKPPAILEREYRAYLVRCFNGIQSCAYYYRVNLVGVEDSEQKIGEQDNTFEHILSLSHKMSDVHTEPNYDVLVHNCNVRAKKMQYFRVIQSILDKMEKQRAYRNFSQQIILLNGFVEQQHKYIRVSTVLSYCLFLVLKFQIAHDGIDVEKLDLIVGNFDMPLLYYNIRGQDDYCTQVLQLLRAHRMNQRALDWRELQQRDGA